MYLTFLNKFILKSFSYLILYPLIDFSLIFTNHEIYNKYCKLENYRKLYIISNIAKSIFLLHISYLFIYILYCNNTLFELDWGENSFDIKNLVISYVIPDFWSILITSKTMKTSTVFHHICVIIATIFIMLSDLNKSGVHISFIVYGLYSVYTFLVNFFLGARFLTNFSSNFMYITNGSYILSCSLNWNWQIYYTINNFYFHYQWFIFLTLLYFWINDDIILNKFLLNYENK
jgi:hypothetical protein